MRRWRRAAATTGFAALVVLAAPGPAAAATYVGLRGFTCDGVTTVGTGLPAGTRLDVALVDPASKRALARGQPTTSAAGAFQWRARISLSGMRRVRAVIRAGGSRPLAWTEQSVPSPCPLATTGPGHTVPMAGVGVSSVALGVLLLLLAFSYQGRHRATPGRHLASTRYRGRHLAVR